MNVETVPNQTKERIRDFLSRFVRNQQLSDDDDIFASGFVNSMMAMQLVMFVEKEFSFTVEDEDLEMSNFRSVNAIASLVERKNQAGTLA
jgi:acyl carrier protein